MFQLFNKIKFRDIFVIIFLILVLFFLFILIYQDHQQKIASYNLPTNLQLKSTKDKVVFFAEYPVLDSNGESIVQYTYTTNNLVPPSNYQGLNEDITKRTSNSQAFLKNKYEIDNGNIREEYVAKFYSGTPFYQSGNNWYQTEVATTTKTAFLQQTESTLVDSLKSFFGQPVFAATNTTYSGVGDGYVAISSSSWAAAHDALTGTVVSYVSTANVAYSRKVSASSYNIYRAFLPFDTSSLGLDVSVTAASLNFYVFEKYDGNDDGNDFITVVQTSQASNTSLTTADYDTCGAVSNPTEGIDVASRKDITSDVTADGTTLHTFNLNATGIGWVSTTGYTKLGIREGHDATNNTVTNLITGLQMYTSEQTGTGQDPYLTIDYRVVYSRVKIDEGKIKIDGGKLKLQ